MYAYFVLSDIFVTPASYAQECLMVILCVSRFCSDSEIIAQCIQQTRKEMAMRVIGFYCKDTRVWRVILQYQTYSMKHYPNCVMSTFINFSMY